MFFYGYVLKLKVFNYIEFSFFIVLKKNKINDEYFGIFFGQWVSIMVIILFNCCLYRGVLKMKFKVFCKVLIKYKFNN